MTLSEPEKRPAVVIGLGLMGCDIAAIFLAGGWRVAAVEPDDKRWLAGRERVRRSVHKDLDRAVAAAYGWPEDIASEDALARLLELNLKRASAARQAAE